MPHRSHVPKELLIVLAVIIAGSGLSILTTPRAQAATAWNVSPGNPGAL